jgi:hypothetical protein
MTGIKSEGKLFLKKKMPKSAPIRTSRQWLAAPQSRVVSRQGKRRAQMFPEDQAFRLDQPWGGGGGAERIHFDHPARQKPSDRTASAKSIYRLK